MRDAIATIEYGWTIGDSGLVWAERLQTGGRPGDFGSIEISRDRLLVGIGARQRLKDSEGPQVNSSWLAAYPMRNRSRPGPH